MDFSSVLLDKIVEFEVEVNGNIRFVSDKLNYESFESAFLSAFRSLYQGRIFKRINAERDIIPEIHDLQKVLGSDGKGSTNIIRRYLNVMGYDQNLIKKEFLMRLNDILNPDIEFTDILIKEEKIDDLRQNAKGEIFFENKNGSWVALSKMGSGVKTIIQILLNLIVVPEMERFPISDFVFGFEELENNLHPSLQRRLFSFISDFAKSTKCIFFITTHSSIVIDLFSGNDCAQIIHVVNNGTQSFVKTVSTNLDGRNILKDLDYRASDLLLTNGVVWVEGPSDAIYLRLLMDIYQRKMNLYENLYYSIQALSTAIWKYAGFSDFDWNAIDAKLENQIISLAKINQNNLIIIDRDDNYEDRLPSEFENFLNGVGKNKARLINEAMRFSNHDEEQLANCQGDTKDGKLFFWVNDGTFETYLEYFVLNKGKDFEKYFDTDKKRSYFEKKRGGENYSMPKVKLAADIAKYSTEGGLNFDDFAPENSALAKKMAGLYKTIKKWNS
jgi:hypothetical protein